MFRSPSRARSALDGASCSVGGFLIPDGRFAGIAYVGLGLDYFTDLFAQDGPGTEWLHVAHAGGPEAARAGAIQREASRHGCQRGGALSLLSEATFRIVRGQLLASRWRSAVYTFTQVGGFPMTISVGRSLQDVYAAWWRRALTIGGIVLAADWGHDRAGPQPAA